MRFVNVFGCELYLINGMSNLGNRLRALGGPSEGVRGTGGQEYIYSFLLPDCENPKGKPGLFFVVCNLSCAHDAVVCRHEFRTCVCLSLDGVAQWRRFEFKTSCFGQWPSWAKNVAQLLDTMRIVVHIGD